MVTVHDCERVQAAWFGTRALALGGGVWTDDDLTWTDGPDGLNLMFPATISQPALRRGLDRARVLGRTIVGAWLSGDVDAAPLMRAGFERGWSPWWMTADLHHFPLAPDPRVSLQHDSSDYTGEHAVYGEQLALTRLEPIIAWYAAAHVGSASRFAGHAWSFLDADLAGVFDVEVWPRFRRHGIGTALVSAVCSAAHRAGADHAVLNATAEGKLLYDTCGFTRVGEGATWWCHFR